MRVLVLNPGSATLKYRLIDLVGSTATPLASGLVEHTSGDSIARAAETVLDRCAELGIQAVGCRIVHGGNRFEGPARVTPEVIAAIRDLGRLAPLHNPIAASVLEGVLTRWPEVPLVAVFDTAFHRTIPEQAALYALPLDLCRKYGWQRYGFHGTSHRYVSTRLLARLGRPATGSRLISCHLGNGASICAIRDGQSVDTSMGLTPLAGLVMGTRSGDVDPGLIVQLLRELHLDADRLEQLLNQQSGLLGIGGHADMRDLQKAALAGDERAVLALSLFCYRIRHYIGAYAAVLHGVDALAFTGGIGENSAVVRQAVCQPLAWLGVRFDSQANQSGTPGEVCLSTADSAVQVWVIPTDEEGLIARETVELLGGDVGRYS